ncbi:cytochrome c550 [Neobacillus sp. SM06]|uniref:cytochrome c550 n=1 Tax=Neobacillus sp. SM06 TaxID=3422492 RepID=UPI003D2A2434
MNRNPIVPFVVIMVFGIALMFGLSFKGNSDAKSAAKEKGSGGNAKTETVSASKPEDIYKNTCITCHGDQYQGVVGPSLKGIGTKLSKDEIKTIITKGKGNMPPNLVSADKADAMAEWVSKIK